MPLPVLWLLRLLQRWFGWNWAVLVVRRDEDVRTLKLPEDLPVSVRENTDGSVGLTVGHDDHGEALLADLRALMGSDGSAPGRLRGPNRSDAVLFSAGVQPAPLVGQLGSRPQLAKLPRGELVMSVKTVAVPLIPGPSEQSAIRTAFTMARGFDGHVVGLHAALKPERSKEIVMSRAGLGFSGDRLRGLHAEEEERTAREADQARRDFFAVAEGMQAKTVDHPPAPSGLSASFKALTAVGSEAMAVYCRVFDLVVVGQPKSDPEHVQRQVLRAMLFTSGRPVLMAPEEPPESVGEVVLIGWNGSALSARAAAISRQHVRRARKVGVVTAKPESAQGPSARDLAEYLAWHGIDATIIEVEVGRRLLGDVLLEAAGDFGADLLVMGAYAHTPFRESLTRGVTNHILSHAHLPVLMAH